MSAEVCINEACPEVGRAFHDAAFCPQCGGKLSVPPPRAPGGSPAKVCVTRGCALAGQPRADAAFCPSCGSPLVDQVTTVGCQTAGCPMHGQVVEGAAFCPGCGAANPEPASPTGRWAAGAGQHRRGATFAGTGWDQFPENLRQATVLDWVVIGAGPLMLVASLLPWYGLLGYGGRNGWQQIVSVIAVLLSIGAALVRVPLAGGATADERRHDSLTVGLRLLGAAALLLVLVAAFDRPAVFGAGEGLRAGWVLGLLAVLAQCAVLGLEASGAQLPGLTGPAGGARQPTGAAAPAAGSVEQAVPSGPGQFGVPGRPGQVTAVAVIYLVRGSLVGLLGIALIGLAVVTGGAVSALGYGGVGAALGLALALGALLVGALGVWPIILGVKMLGGEPWTRVAAFVTEGVITLFSLIDIKSSAGTSLLSLGLVAAVVILLCAEPAVRYFASRRAVQDPAGSAIGI